VLRDPDGIATDRDGVGVVRQLDGGRLRGLRRIEPRYQAIAEVTDPDGFGGGGEPEPSDVVDVLRRERPGVESEKTLARCRPDELGRYPEIPDVTTEEQDALDTDVFDLQPFVRAGGRC
jgi:hypothetical protein